VGGRSNKRGVAIKRNNTLRGLKNPKKKLNNENRGVKKKRSGKEERVHIKVRSTAKRGETPKETRWVGFNRIVEGEGFRGVGGSK